MCVALAFLHARRVTYRDLKPQNVLLKAGRHDELHICFTDFGFSKELRSGALSHASSTGFSVGGNRMDSLAGTPLYAAPEIMAIAQHQNREEYTPAVDLFSLGRTMLVMLWRT